MIDKKEVLGLLRAKLDADLRSFLTSQGAAQASATHEETRQEDPKDTRSIEATYLARGLAERVELTREVITIFSRLRLVDFGPDDTIGVTALVGLEHEAGKERVYFLVPSAGGETLALDGATIRTLTPVSPLGRALIGKQVEDEVELNLPGKRVAARIAWTR